MDFAEEWRLRHLYDAQEREREEVREHGHLFEDSRPCEVCRAALKRRVYLKYDHCGSAEDRKRWWNAKPLDWTERVYVKEERVGDRWYLPPEPLFQCERVSVEGVERRHRREWTGEVWQFETFAIRKRRDVISYTSTTNEECRFSVLPAKRERWHAHGSWHADHTCALCGGCLHEFSETLPVVSMLRATWYQCRHCGVRWVEGRSGTAHAAKPANLLAGKDDRTLDRSKLPRAIASAVGNLVPPVSFETLREHLRQNHLAYNLTNKLIRRGIKLALTTGLISVQAGSGGIPHYRHGGSREPRKVSATIRLSDVPEDQRTGETFWIVIMGQPQECSPTSPSTSAEPPSRGARAEPG